MLHDSNIAFSPSNGRKVLKNTLKDTISIDAYSNLPTVLTKRSRNSRFRERFLFYSETSRRLYSSAMTSFARLRKTGKNSRMAVRTASVIDTPDIRHNLRNVSASSSSSTTDIELNFFSFFSSNMAISYEGWCVGFDESVPVPIEIMPWVWQVCGWLSTLFFDNAKKSFVSGKSRRKTRL